VKTKILITIILSEKKENLKELFILSTSEGLEKWCLAKTKRFHQFCTTGVNVTAGYMDEANGIISAGTLKKI